ncbi:hypothetical protein [Streptosporangium vulgare]|uniref:hypothetical protein n=1 Tax=Streptosporangium vulgare TaxID=46190 RepID=UPI0031D4CFDE
MATRKAFGDLMMRSRSEGVGVVVAGGRGTVEFLGNGKIKKDVQPVRAPQKPLVKARSGTYSATSDSPCPT